MVIRRTARVLTAVKHRDMDETIHIPDLSSADIERQIAYNLKRIRDMRQFKLEDELYRCSGDAVFETTRALPRWR